MHARQNELTLECVCISKLADSAIATPTMALSQKTRQTTSFTTWGLSVALDGMVPSAIFARICLHVLLLISMAL